LVLALDLRNQKLVRRVSSGRCDVKLGTSDMQTQILWLIVAESIHLTLQ